MSSTTAVFAWTAPGGTYPEYVNMTPQDDMVRVTVRSLSIKLPLHPDPNRPDQPRWDSVGPLASMLLPDELAMQCGLAMVTHQLTKQNKVMLMLVFENHEDLEFYLARNALPPVGELQNQEQLDLNEPK